MSLVAAYCTGENMNPLMCNASQSSLALVNQQLMYLAAAITDAEGQKDLWSLYADNERLLGQIGMIPVERAQQLIDIYSQGQISTGGGVKYS